MVLSRGNPAVQCALLRDIFGKPFRTIDVDPAWLTWKNGCVVHIAQAIYDNRDYKSVGILADALVEAGCADQHILEHGRSPGPHVRGCWLMDLILGKT